jgi:hypothetical protein
MTFDPVLHEYRDGDLIIQSVTQILKRAGHIDDRWYSEEARERGSAVHELCERFNKGIRTLISAGPWTPSNTSTHSPRG